MGRLALFALAGACADIDFVLPLQHRGPTHSLGAALVVLAVAYLMCLRLGRKQTPGSGVTPIRGALAIAAGYGSHTLLDWLGADSSAPQGIMALWPISSEFHISKLDVFSSVDRRYWTDGFWARNLRALVGEILILGPVALLSMYKSRGRSSARAGRPRPSA